mmetsp:Transcript_26997/g.78366  ORF Transcript_26997/g.78366 Transcript_26997/m.78366 type:complete len:201 (-) Transcript_26997:167-769(-)
MGAPASAGEVPDRGAAVVAAAAAGGAGAPPADDPTRRRVAGEARCGDSVHCSRPDSSYSHPEGREIDRPKGGLPPAGGRPPGQFFPLVPWQGCCLQAPWTAYPSRGHEMPLRRDGPPPGQFRPAARTTQTPRRKNAQVVILSSDPGGGGGGGSDKLVVLLQLRSYSMPVMPGHLATVGGMRDYSDADSRVTAIREELSWR